MRFSFGIAALIALITTSCNWNKPGKSHPAVTKDTLVYSYKTFKQRANDCGGKADTGCTVFSFKYPDFIDQTELNDTIKNKFLLTFGQSGKDTGITQAAKSFFEDYQNFKKNPRYLVFYTVDSYAKVLRQDSSLTTIELGGYEFRGGAHPLSFIKFINWNTKANKIITLNEIFTDGYEEKLNAIAEKVFRKNERLADTASLAVNYFFKNNKFALNSNFSLTPLGIRFLYNQYEIKPYAAGTTSLFIPYSETKFLLRPHTVVAQFIK